MLSIENPPPDPSRPCEISQLKISDDERASDKQEETDLFISDLDDTNPVPKFSIRDYVFSTRSKDIKTNWPFSSKSLQLCLNHGVEDLLPPFQPLDSVKNRALIDRKIPNSDGETSRPSNRVETISSENVDCNEKLDTETISSKNVDCNEKLDTDCVDISPSGVEGDKESPSTSANPPVKKCKLIVRLGTEDIMSNCSTFSETMASKVCPVCKTFSSSSNTTLNAHIDQCLSVESPIKWTSNSLKVVTKHRIKPRKTKLMVDIYETAKPCTLEELDRRNGTSWAKNSVLPIQENEVCDEEKNRRVVSVNVEDSGDKESEVYIDASGTKVRILSKFNEALVSKVGSENGPRKFLKGLKRSKILLAHKRKCHGQKNQRYSKLVHQSKKMCSLSPNCGSEIYAGLERHRAVEERPEKEEHPRQQIIFSNSGSMRKWVSSKQTGLLKKTKVKKSLQPLGYSSRQDLLVENGRSSLGDLHVDRSFVVKTPNSSERPLYSPQSSKKKTDNLSYEVVDEMEHDNDNQNPLKKRARFSFRSHISGKTKQSRKESSDPVEIDAGSVKVPNSFSKSSWRSLTFSSKATKFSSLRSSLKKKMSALNCNFNGKYSAPSEVDEWRDDSLQNHGENQSRVEEANEKVPLGKHGLLRIRKKRRGAIGNSRREENSALRCSYFDVEENVDSSIRASGSLADPVHDEDMDIDPSFGIAIPSYTQPNSLGCDEVFKGSFYGPTEPSLADAQEMFCGDEVVGEEIGRNTHLGAESDSKSGQENNYFAGVDPIPIPGPPGSFLPSPRGMSSEDLQGNSSLTTSRLLSSEDHHDLVERDSSGSPISATSTISNSGMVRSDSRSSDWLSVGPHMVKHEAMSLRAQNINIDEMKDNTIFPEKGGPPGFQNDKPCCCSRKEGSTSKGLALNYQESQLLRRRTMSSSFPGKQTSNDPNKGPFNMNLKPETFCESSNPSTSNPVLRLMGKNLMVVNKDADVSPQIRETHSGVLRDHPNPQYRTFPGISHGNIRNWDLKNNNQMVHQEPLIFGQNQDKIVGPALDSRLSKSFGSHVINPGTPNTPSHASTAMFPLKNIGGGYKLDSMQTYDMERIGAIHDHPQYRNPDSNGNPMKEIIVIDDTPEIEANSNARQSNTFYSGSPVVGNASFKIPTPRRANASPVEWDYTLDGSKVIHPSSLLASSSSSTGHPRSSIYYAPPSFS